MPSFDMRRRGRAAIPACVLLSALLAPAPSSAQYYPEKPAPAGSTVPGSPATTSSSGERTIRRPIALQLSTDQRTLFVANQRAGSISLIDRETGKVVGERKIGRRLSDLVLSADGKQLLATDELAHELIVLKVLERSNATADVEVQHRTPVSPFPVSVSTTKDGSRAYVASLWSRRLVRVDLQPSAGEAPRVAQTLDLPVAPRKQLLLPDQQRLIVADSFGGKLLVIDVAAWSVANVREFPAHNIRGLALNHDGTMLVVAHQMLNDLAHTIRNDVHWGLLMTNDLRWLKLDRVLASSGDLYSGGHMHPLGGAGNASGDPNGLAFAPDGTVIVTLGGVSEISMGKEAEFSLYRTPVGKRPTAVVTTRDSRWAYVANTSSDSVSVVDLNEREAKSEISLGPQPELTLVDRGELLFYDASLSHDGWMSCQSCHSEGHTNGQLNDNFSDKSFGAPKRVLSLLGRADTAPFAWNGSSASLSEQIRKSLINTMQGASPPSDRTVEALTAYIESLESPPSIDVLRGTRDEAAVARGQTLFTDLRCVRCHAAPSYTTPRTYNVGLKDQQGNDHFNPPSLRGVGQRAPYFHDNRAATLESVLREHKHQVRRDLTDAELADLTAFLRSL